MPASTTRPCRTCGEERTFAEFREPGDKLGRPPVNCRDCRAKSEALQARHEANVAYRPENRDRHVRVYASRSVRKILSDRAFFHPDGLKTCPANAGCGRALPFDAYTSNVYQHDGLSPLCAECDRERAAVAGRWAS